MPIHRSRHPLLAATIALASLAGQAVPSDFKLHSGARCDLVSAVVADTTSCLDVSSLDGTTLRVPSGTTRISTAGLVLCARKEQSTAPMDIVYVVDQSPSMVPNAIVVDGADTIAFTDAGADVVTAASPTVDYHGVKVFVIDPSLAAKARASCTEAGDPTSLRAQLVKDAMLQQARLSPGSQAAWIPFAAMFKRRAMTDLSDTAALSAQIGLIQNFYWGGTSYSGPLAWSRLLLEGGSSPTGAGSPRAGSPNARKAVLMISDGEPTDSTDYLKDIGSAATVKDSLNNTWTTGPAAMPPVYGILLTTSKRPGKALEAVAAATGGRFFQIPPSRPDSLRRTISSILGSLMGTGRPDSLRIRNATNGQVSLGVGTVREAGGYRFRLDSLVGLAPGRNVLELRFVLVGSRDSVVTARWTIEVGDPASAFSPLGTDSILLVDCHDASRLRLAPQKDTARAFADERDTILRLSLETRTDGQFAHAISFGTSVSSDAGIRLVGWNPPPSAARASTAAPLLWTPAAATVAGDSVVQTGIGADTLHALFRMPRDPRDSAVASLPLRRLAPPSLRFLQDTSSAISGSLALEAVDASRGPDSLTASVASRSGDTVLVLLRRVTGSVFRGSVSFRQGAAPIRADAILQTGPYRGASPFDTLEASYLGASDRAVLRRPEPRLRFLDDAGLPRDSLPGATLDPGGSTTFRVGLFIGSDPVPWTDSVSLEAPSWLSVAPGGRLVGGILPLRATAVDSGSDGRIRILRVGTDDTLVFAPIRVRAYRIRFRHADGSVSDTLSVVARVRDTASILVEVWDSDSPCASCSGHLRLAPSAPSLATASTDGFALVSGRGLVAVTSASPLSGASLRIFFDSLGADGTVHPVHFLAPAPDSASYLDSDGDGALDRIRLHLRTPWTGDDSFAFPWPDAAHPVPLAGATFLPDLDSTTLEILLPAPHLVGTTAWTGGAAFEGSWSPAPGIPPSPFPIVERIAPIPLSARIGRGVGVDTLLILSSEPIDERVVSGTGALALRRGVPTSLLATSRARWDSASRTLLLLYPSSAIDSIVAPGDSVRFSPLLRDREGNAPGIAAPYVEVVGVDRAPESAAMLDLDSDGRADHVRLRFATAPRAADVFAFAWSDGRGGAQSRTADGASAVRDPSRRILTFSVPPYPYGATACPASGCASLGSMSSSRCPACAPLRFDLADSVPPAILDARLLFGVASGSPDTLIATASEPVAATDGSEWIRWGRPSRDPRGATIARLGQSSDSVALVLLLDPSIEASIQDSVRLASPPLGGVEDRGHVAPGSTAPWVPLRVGPLPRHLRISPHPAFLEHGGWEIPASEPALEIFVRSGPSEPWRTLDGSAPAQDPACYLGLLLEANIAFERGAVFLYDNMATSLGSLDLSALAAAAAAGTLPTTPRGGYQAWIAWNGRSRSGGIAASGTYPMRVVLWDRDGTRIAYNGIHVLGWKRNLAP